METPIKPVTETVQDALNRAIQLHTSGASEEAERLCRALLPGHPDHPVLLHLTGVICLKNAKPDEALTHIQKAIRSLPTYAQAHSSLGNVFDALGRSDDAIGSFRKALELEPGLLEAHFNAGRIRARQGKPVEAAEFFKDALKQNPNFAEARFQLGIVLHEQEKLEEAVACYQALLEQMPNAPEVLNNLGSVYKDMDDFPQAMGHYRKALSVDPDYAEAYFNLGNVLLDDVQLDQALAHFDKALALRPDYTNALRSKGITLMTKGETGLAVTQLEEALALAPDDILTQHNLSLALLSDGHYTRGLELYECRWRSDPEKNGWRDFPQPVWDGADLTGKKIVVWAEQGLGDQMVFASLYPELLRRGAQCLFECESRLVPLFERSFPQATIVPQADPPMSALLDPSIDYQIAAGSLARHLLTALDREVPRENYLTPDLSRVQNLDHIYRRERPKAVVGLGWHTNHDKLRKRYNFPLEFFDPLLAVPDVQFVTLQYGDHQSDIDACYERTGVRILKDPSVDPIKDIDGFSAQVAAMDLVISLVNSTAVMGPAVDVPTWGIVPAVSEWRWGNQTDTCLWYPSMSLFRLSQDGDWRATSRAVSDAFSEWIAAR